MQGFLFLKTWKPDDGKFFCRTFSICSSWLQANAILPRSALESIGANTRNPHVNLKVLRILWRGSLAFGPNHTRFHRSTTTWSRSQSTGAWKCLQPGPHGSPLQRSRRGIASIIFFTGEVVKSFHWPGHSSCQTITLNVFVSIGCVDATLASCLRTTEESPNWTMDPSMSMISFVGR